MKMLKYVIFCMSLIIICTNVNIVTLFADDQSVMKDDLSKIPTESAIMDNRAPIAVKIEAFASSNSKYKGLNSFFTHATTKDRLFYSYEWKDGIAAREIKENKDVQIFPFEDEYVAINIEFSEPMATTQLKYVVNGITPPLEAQKTISSLLGGLFNEPKKSDSFTLILPPNWNGGKITLYIQGTDLAGNSVDINPVTMTYRCNDTDNGCDVDDTTNHKWGKPTGTNWMFERSELGDSKNIINDTPPIIGRVKIANLGKIKYDQYFEASDNNSRTLRSGIKVERPLKSIDSASWDFWIESSDIAKAESVPNQNCPVKK